MGHTTPRPRDRLRPSYLRLVLLAVLDGALSSSPCLATPRRRCVPFARGERSGSRCPVPVAISPSDLPPTTGERVWGCAMSRWPSLLPRCSAARLAPERSPRLEGVWHLLFRCRPCPSLAWRRCSSRVRVWPFPPFGGERKHSQTLNFQEETHHGSPQIHL